MWTMFFGLFGISLVMPRSVLGLLECSHGKFDMHQNLGVWRAVPHCLMWCLWREVKNTMVIVLRIVRGLLLS